MAGEEQTPAFVAEQKWTILQREVVRMARDGSSPTPPALHEAIAEARAEYDVAVADAAGKSAEISSQQKTAYRAQGAKALREEIGPALGEALAEAWGELTPEAEVPEDVDAAVRAVLGGFATRLRAKLDLPAGD